MFAEKTVNMRFVKDLMFASIVMNSEKNMVSMSTIFFK